jgi:hypothetical protein
MTNDPTSQYQITTAQVKVLVNYWMMTNVQINQRLNTNPKFESHYNRMMAQLSNHLDKYSVWETVLPYDETAVFGKPIVVAATTKPYQASEFIGSRISIDSKGIELWSIVDPATHIYKCNVICDWYCKMDRNGNTFVMGSNYLPGDPIAPDAKLSNELGLAMLKSSGHMHYFPHESSHSKALENSNYDFRFWASIHTASKVHVDSDQYGWHSFTGPVKILNGKPYYYIYGRNVSKREFDRITSDIPLYETTRMFEFLKNGKC